MACGALNCHDQMNREIAPGKADTAAAFARQESQYLLFGTLKKMTRLLSSLIDLNQKVPQVFAPSFITVPVPSI